ncbi:MAG: ATP-dependent DNA helicase RecG [Candidatus Omnitrophica bacterium]|nr:ATP-dependent DNA helicase RecG [Candidatus Omnitrophota bacterium]
MQYDIIISMPVSIYDSIQFLKGVGPKRSKSFQALGINTIEDLLYYFPRRYQDWRDLRPISDLKEGDAATVKGKVCAVSGRTSWQRRGFNILEARIEDSTGRIRAVWFNQPYLKDYLKTGVSLVLHGKIEKYGHILQLASPEFEMITDEEEALSRGSILPVYPLSDKFSQRYFRKIIGSALDEFITRLKDPLPYDVRKRNSLLNSAQGLINIHFPRSDELQKEAYRRLSFEDFFLFEVPIIMKKASRPRRKAVRHNAGSPLLNDFIGSLSFRFTASQTQVLNEILADMSSDKIMQRLIQGDVGCGKTVVALCASLAAIDSGWQTAFMVPTEILARQHYAVISGFLDGLSRPGPKSKKLKIGLMTGALSAKSRREAVKQIKDGKVDLTIGTHSLIERDVVFERLGLIVIDEQHKFGVAQRKLLSEKNRSADTLIMTATPIPRTLAITLYGNLDISAISELPPGRGRIQTRHFAEGMRRQAYGLIKEELAKKRQAYIIYPIIDESYALDLNAAEKMFKQLSGVEFKDYRLGLIHGRIKQEQQNKTMEKFKAGEIDILVATSVLEVGIDVPDATVMLIEHCDRFGLSQLHQLRGRIGRSGYDSICLLMGEPKTEEARRRIDAIVNNIDGFKIAEEDLKIRGPGEFFGSRQHGLSELRIGNPLTQLHILKSARDEAARLIEADPELNLRQDQDLKAALERRYPGYREKQVVG